MNTLADTIRARLDEITSAVDRRARGEEVLSYIPTGLKSWDANGGIMRGILTVIGAGTGEGKSIVKLQLARGAAESGHRVLMLDFEDPARKTADRVFSQVTGINSRDLGLLQVEDFDVQRLRAAVTDTSGWASRITYAQGLLDARKVLSCMRECKADLTLVDYAQAFPEDGDLGMERTIARFAWEANAFAQSEDVAVVAFSQIVREVEQRGYRIYERAKFRDPGCVDVSGFAPGGLSDIAWAKSLGERCKELAYLWRENRIAAKLGAKVKDNRLRVIFGKVNFGAEKDLLFEFDGPTATLRDLRTA